MRFAYDLHIHSALSPCGDEYMTPNNIVNMSLLNELDIIALTDHNSAENIAAILDVASKTELTVIPGMEVETQEEFHTICLLPDVTRVLELQKYVYANLPNIKNKAEIFGKQFIVDENDDIAGENERLLLTAAGISIYELIRFVDDAGGVAIPAHVDKSSYSIIVSLGFIPRDLAVSCIEITKNTEPDKFFRDNSYLRCKHITNSDAHYLEHIGQKDYFFDLPDKKPQTVIDFLKSKL